MSKPNILVLMLEHGHYGTICPDSPVDLPNMKSISDEGAWFESMYTVAGHSCPARATFFTSVYPSLHGIYNNCINPAAIHTRIRDGVKHWSASLKQLGYELRLTGKWHINAEEGPETQGWQGFGNVNALHMTGRGTFEPGAAEKAAARVKGYERLVNAVVAKRNGWPDALLSGAHTGDPKQTREYQLGQDAIEQIKTLGKGNAPWCIYCGWGAVHDPYTPPVSYAERFPANKVELPANYLDSLDDKPAIYRRQHKFWSQLNEDQVRQAIAHYQAWCAFMDDIIGEMLATLEQTGQKDNTIVVLNTDHGDYLGAHGLWLKGIPCFEEAYRLPTAIRWPAGLGVHKRRIKSLCNIADFGATFLEAAGAEPARQKPAAADGRAGEGRPAQRILQPDERSRIVLYAAYHAHRSIQICVQRIRLRRALRPGKRSGRDVQSHRRSGAAQGP